MCNNPTCGIKEKHKPRPPKPGRGGHLFFDCVEPCPEPATCQWCDGGLAMCVLCRGMEGSLPSECPGVRMDDELAERVYAGKTDFRAGRWVVLVRRSVRRAGS